MGNNFASLCVLAYKRPERLIECIDSLIESIDYPCEIIVNLDGSDAKNESLLFQKYVKGEISKLILSNGNNRGVGRSFQNCLGVAEGDYIFKLDADLIFKPGWLSTSVKILQNNPTVGAVGLFDYNVQDPNDERFKPENNVLYERESCYIVNDFVSCGYGFRKEHTPITTYQMPDDGFHQSFKNIGLNLALTKGSVVDNKSFGFDSVYVQVKPDGSATKTPTYAEPLVFRKNPPTL